MNVKLTKCEINGLTKGADMLKNGFLKTLVFAVLLGGVSTSGLFAQLTVSGGFALSSVKAEAEGRTYEGEVGLGANVYFDYLLPIGIPLSLGGEIGIDSATIGEEGWIDTVLAVPLLLRAAYHFDLDPKLDLFLVGKLGYVIGTIVDGPDAEYFTSAGGFGFGVDIGAAYYFTSLFGAFIEAGVDGYMVKSKFDVSGTDFTVNTPFYRFVTFGLSFRK
jgi:hypothetical protein